MNSTTQQLLEIRELLSVPERWFKGSYAGVTIDGVKISINEAISEGKLEQEHCFQSYHSKADCWCLLGANTKVHDPEIGFSNWGTMLKRAIYDLSNHRMIHEFNDDPLTTHADVLRVLDRAIELSKEI